MKRTTPELAPPLKTSASHQQLWALWVGRWAWVVATTPAGGRLAPFRMILRATGPHTRRIVSGSGFRALNHSAPKQRHYH
ncbi:hypothetical protein AVEN_155844-1 [Araneus ventricosus]|uniref:Uncharacterized protein n=1 Tax=Araneus ventricosus TaxID=182803 RepID=A0A4Y2HT00_ARAVE|nr:hypothetical protein AVEN_155844-1 [Araneus ventricosus]